MIGIIESGYLEGQLLLWLWRRGYQNSTLPEHAAAGSTCLAPVLTCALVSVATV